MIPSKRRRTMPEDSNNDSDTGSSSASSSHDIIDVQPENPQSSTLVVPPSSSAGVVAEPVKNARRKSAFATAPELIDEMREYKSNMFRMLTLELLSEMEVDYVKRMVALETVLHKLKAVIDVIPEKKGMKIMAAETEMKKRRICIPFPKPRPAKDLQYLVAYAKPSYVNVAGSYALKSLLKQKGRNSIDLVLTMPPDIFQEKDYLNYRYFYKRAYYLAVVAAGIADCKELTGLRLEYDYMNGDHLRPILVILPSGDGTEFDFTSSKCTIKIIPSGRPNLFPIRKLFPAKNCVRPKQSLDTKETENEYPPTPFYNSSLAADMTYFPYLARLHGSSSSTVAYSNACKMGRIWLRQRGFGGAISQGGFGHFEWALLVSFLLKGGDARGHALLALGYSNYQMFKGTLQFLALRDLSTDPLVFNTTESVQNPCNKLPVIFDGEHGVNLLFKMNESSYRLLRHEAKRTLDCLNNTTFTGQFDVVFIQKVDGPCFRFDAVACVPFPAEAELKIQSKGAESGSPIEQYASRIYDVLKEGFGDRISLLHISYTDETSFPIRGRHKSGQTGSFVIGLLLYAKAISRLIDRGPSPEEKKKAAAFRKFWGDKAELRRFPDGSIIECVSWENKGQKVPIYQQIITYVIGQHFSKEVAESTTFIGEEFGQLLCGGLHGNIAFQPVFDGFDVLVKDLRDLTGIPLAMRHISATGATARATAVHLPPTNGTGIMEPTDVVVQFESSGKWPDDLVAIQMTKTSFLIKMGELLKEAKDTELFIRIGLENGENPIMNQVFLDVIYQTGIAFRIRIYHDHEDHLLQTRSRDSTLLRREKQAASVALSAHRRAFVLAPRHSDGIRQLSHRFPLFSPTVRLVKKWFTVHLLSAHVADELLELLVARTFLYPFPWAPPSSIMVGFLRTMQYLAKWDWRVDPLIVDLSGDKSMKSADFQVIRTRFEAVRKTDPAMNQFTMFVATNYDQDRSLWTEGRPAKVVAARITTLAGAVVAAAIEKSTLDREELARLFSPCVTDYDFVLHLDPQYIGLSRDQPLSRKNPGSKYKNLRLEKEYNNPITEREVSKLGFDPIADFGDEISIIYDNIILFFRGAGGTIIGGVWYPNTPRSWKPNLGYSSILAGIDNPRDYPPNDERVLVNKAAILNEIARLGGGLVTKVVNKL